MTEEFAIRRMVPNEAPKASALALKVFRAFVAPQYGEEGVREFESYAEPGPMSARSMTDHIILGAEINDKLVGVLELRDFGHISLLFVEERLQRRGAGRALVSRALEIIQKARPDLSRLTVNASPNAVNAYASLGFAPDGPEQEIHGIRFCPMTLNIP